MKKFLLFTAALFTTIGISAQTITIDGDNSDWANIPMLTKPGDTLVVKIVVPQEGLTQPDGAAFSVMVSGNHEKILAGYPVIVTDADKDNTTGTKPSYCPAMGYDYEMATWSSGSLFAANGAGSIREMTIKQAAFSKEGLGFDGTINAWLTFNWGELYIPSSPSDNGWKWGEEKFHPLYVRPFAFKNLNNTHTPSEVYGRHQVLAPGNVINMAPSGDAISSHDTEMWASWAVELTISGVYDITANITSSNTASVDLKLVSTATNAVVASFASGDLSAGTEVAVGSWDLSKVPAGKYMLVFSNHVGWSAMKLNSLTLSTDDIPSGMESVDNTKKANKVIYDGKVYINRDGKIYNILGTIVK